MIVIADALAVALIGTTDADLPVFGWDNLVTSSNIAATYENTSYPAVNLANSSTVQLWKSTNTGTQYLTATLGSAHAVNFVGVARHNFADAGAQLTVEGDPGTGSWQVLAGPQIVGDNRPLMFVLDDGNWTGVRLKIESATDYPQAAVFSVGQALRMMRGVQPGLTPFPYGRTREFVNGSAQNGDYLGEIEIRSRIAGTVNFKALYTDWYRTSMADFVDAARTPFFFAWMPASYPTECGFCWATDDPRPAWSYGVPDWIDIEISMEGLSL